MRHTAVLAAHRRLRAPGSGLRAGRIGAAALIVLSLGCGGEKTGTPQPTGPAAGGGGTTSVAGGGGAPAAGQAASSAGAAAGALAAGAGASAGRGAAGAPAQAGSSVGASAPDAGTAGAAAGSGAAGMASQAGMGASDAGLMMDAAMGGATLPPVSGTDADGPFQAMQDLRGGPRGQSGIFRPTELGKDGVKHPVFVWGCGGGSTPMSYADQLRRIATHGFVVIAEVSQIGDNGAPLKASIDWILAENERDGSPFAGTIETSKVALGGHSIGSVNSFMIADDPRLTTTIHVAGGSLDNVNDPFAPTTGTGGKRLVHPVAYICSMSDTFGNVEKTEKDYANTTAPAFMTIMTGVEHVGAARSGLPATIAWLRWHLAGEVERRSAFLEPNGEFTSGIFVSRNKNW